MFFRQHKVKRSWFSGRISEIDGYEVQRGLTGRVNKIGEFEVRGSWFGSGTTDDPEMNSILKYIQRDDKRLRGESSMDEESLASRQLKREWAGGNFTP